jgi:hypothetical protein
MRKGVRNMGKGVRNMRKGVRNIRNTLRNIMIQRLICFLIRIVWLRRCPILAPGSDVPALAVPFFLTPTKRKRHDAKASIGQLVISTHCRRSQVASLQASSTSDTTVAMPMRLGARGECRQNLHLASHGGKRKGQTFFFLLSLLPSSKLALPVIWISLSRRTQGLSVSMSRCPCHVTHQKGQ